MDERKRHAGNKTAKEKRLSEYGRRFFIRDNADNTGNEYI